MCLRILYLGNWYRESSRGKLRASSAVPVKWAFSISKPILIYLYRHAKSPGLSGSAPGHQISQTKVSFCRTLLYGEIFPKSTRFRFRVFLWPFSNLFVCCCCCGQKAWFHDGPWKCKTNTVQRFLTNNVTPPTFLRFCRNRYYKQRSYSEWDLSKNKLDRLGQLMPSQFLLHFSLKRLKRAFKVVVSKSF